MHSGKLCSSSVPVPAHPDVVLIHYSGNDQIAENFPHGNSVKSVNFLPTATSLGARLADKSVKLADLQAQTVCEDIQFPPQNANQKRYFERKQSLNCDSFLSFTNSHILFQG